MPVFIELHKAVGIISSSLPVRKDKSLKVRHVSLFGGESYYSVIGRILVRLYVRLTSTEINPLKPGRTLTSTIILQLLHGPICVKTCRMRGSVTSLDRFPTYLQARTEMAGIESLSNRK